MSIKKHTEGAIFIQSVLSTLTTVATTEDAATAIYQITSVTTLWPGSSVTAVGGTVDQSWGDRGWDYFQGRVKLTDTGISALVVNVTSCTLQEIGYVYSVTPTMTRSTGEVTAIGDTWRQLTPLEVSVSITLERYRFDNLMESYSGASAFTMANGDWILFELLEDATEGYFAKCLMTQHVFNKAVGNVDSEPITLEVSSWMQRVV